MIGPKGQFDRADVKVVTVGGGLAYGATLVCVTPSLTAGLARALARLRRGRHRVLVVTALPLGDEVGAFCDAHHVETQQLVSGARRVAV